MLVGHREEQPAGIEVQIDVAGKPPVGRPIERGQPPVRPRRREHGNLIVVTGGRQARVALIVCRQPQAILPTLDQQQPVEIQQRIGQQGLGPQTVELGGHVRDLSWGRRAGLSGEQFVVRPFPAAEPLAILLAITIPSAERVAQIVNRQFEGLPFLGPRLAAGFGCRGTGSGLPRRRTGEVGQQVGRQVLEVLRKPRAATW